MICAPFTLWISWPFTARRQSRGHENLRKGLGLFLQANGPWISLVGRTRSKSLCYGESLARKDGARFRPNRESTVCLTHQARMIVHTDLWCGEGQFCGSADDCELRVPASGLWQSGKIHKFNALLLNACSELAVSRAHRRVELT